MSLQEYVAGEQITKVEFVDLPRLQPLASTREIAIACPQNIQSRAHQIECRTVRGNILNPDPKIQIAAVARHKHARMDRSRHFGVFLQYWGVEGQNVRAFRELSI